MRRAGLARIRVSILLTLMPSQYSLIRVILRRLHDSDPSQCVRLGTRIRVAHPPFPPHAAGFLQTAGLGRAGTARG